VAWSFLNPILGLFPGARLLGAPVRPAGRAAGAAGAVGVHVVQRT
jgi:hypothetical protein